MKILYFSNAYTPHDHRFLTAIRDGGHQAFHLRLQINSNQGEDRPVPEGVEIVSWAGGRRGFRWVDLPRYVISLREVIRRIQPDIIHAGPIQTCAFIAALTGFRPLLAMSWGYDLMENLQRGRGWEWVTRYTLKRSTYFTSDAQVTRNIAVEYGMDPEKMVIFPWGVNLQHFSPPAVNRSPSDAFTLFCNRAWEPMYGIDVLAGAFVRVTASRPDVSLILLSGGSQAGHIRQILMKGGTLERVHFGGLVSQNDLPRWYHKADLYISPSHVDGSSVSLMEALACGLPCLVSDIPGNREWVSEGENGWLFRDGDADALAEKVLLAIENRQSLPEIGRKARATAEARANWEENAKKLLAAYEQAMKFR